MSAPKYTAFETYQVYVAMKNHFDSKSNYDYIKYNGKMNLKWETFNKRKDSKLFFRLSRKVSSKYMVHWLLSGFSVKKDPWIANFLEGDMEEIYKKWKNRIKYLDSHYSNQLQMILRNLANNSSSEFIELMEGNEENYPEIINIYENEGVISTETFLILSNVFGVFKSANYNLGEFVNYTNIPDLEYKIEAYSKFFDLDYTKYKRLSKQIIREELQDG